MCCRPLSNPIYFSIAYIRRIAIAQTSKATALAIGKAMLDKKAVDVQVLHVAPLTSVADYIDGTLSRSGQRPLSIEGTSSGQWVLLDFGDVVAHIFRQDTRSHYALERLWSDATQLPIPEEAPAPVAAPKRRIVVRKAAAHKTV
jgi:ribosome-associated protein